MPRRSERSRLLELVELDGLIGLKCARSKEEFDKEMESVTENLELIFSTRFLIPKARIPKSHEWFLQVLPQLDNDRFKQQLRVTREEFNSLLALIVEDPLFSSKTSPQITPGLQLAIVLYRFGHYGTAASYANVAAKFGIGDGGSIIDITKRVITAILKLKPRFVYWANKDERISLASRVEDVLPGCIGFVDGTHVNMEERPSTAHPDDYFSRKQRYGLQLQAVCDVNLTIRHFVVGYTASVHDAKVYNSCCLALEPDKYFTNDQWLAGDAAYKLTETVLTPFRKNSTVRSASERRSFNRIFSSHRVKIEHTFGVLKEKFGSLKELRVRVADQESHTYACKWIETCCVLYNILRNDDDVEFYGVESQLEADPGEDLETAEVASAGAENKRMQLMEFVLQHHR